MNVLAQRVGRRIRHDREARGWTQLELADALSDAGGPRYSSRISIWESGRSLPSEDHRQLLARVLGVPVDRYFAWSHSDDEPLDASR